MIQEEHMRDKSKFRPCFSTPAVTSVNVCPSPCSFNNHLPLPGDPYLLEHKQTLLLRDASVKLL